MELRLHASLQSELSNTIVQPDRIVPIVYGSDTFGCILYNKWMEHNDNVGTCALMSVHVESEVKFHEPVNLLLQDI